MDSVIVDTLSRDTWMITVGTQKDTSYNGIAIAEKYPHGLWCSVGLHPNHLFPVYIDEDEHPFMTREEDFDYAYYKQLALSSERVVAIGECGLDYFRIPKDLDENMVHEKQEQVFRAQLDLADEIHLPVILHIRDAHDRTIAILKEYVSKGKLARRGVIHCFTSLPSHAREYIALGFYVSFTGIITFPPKKSDATSMDTLYDAVRAVPLTHLLIETDAPYLTPVPFRGERNVPHYVSYIAQQVADIKHVSLDEVAHQTTENAKVLFLIS